MTTLLITFLLHLLRREELRRRNSWALNSVFQGERLV